MFRKFTLAAVATIIGMVIAAKLTAGQHVSVFDWGEPYPVAPTVKPAKAVNQSEKEIRASNGPFPSH